MRDFLGDGYLSCRISGPIYMAAHRIVSIYRYMHTHTCLHELYGFGARIAHAEAPIRSTPAGLFQTPGGLLISEYNIPILLPLVILIPDCAGFPTLGSPIYPRSKDLQFWEPVAHMFMKLSNSRSLESGVSTSPY